MTRRGRSSTPRWSTQKGGRAGRAQPPRPPRQPLPPSGRRRRHTPGDPARGRKRERTAPPAAARRRAAGARALPGRDLGRPRLRHRGAARGAPGALARAADQPQAAAWPAAAGGRADDLARPQAAREDARSARARALAGRAHECLAAQLAPGLYPLGAPSGALPRAAPARLLDDRLPRARPVIVRPLPVPKNGCWDSPRWGQSFLSPRSRNSAVTSRG